jgi:hypothetical protein
MDGHYMLPGEFALVLVALVAPALALSAVLLLVSWLRSQRRASSLVLALSLAFVAVIGTALSFALLVWSPSPLGFLAVRDVPRGGLPVFPGAFVSFACALLLPLRWVRTRGASV